jgi:hypothetical protein
MRDAGPPRDAQEEHPEMAEMEIIKHAKRVLDTARRKEASWAKKLMELVLEISIIVFAVTISLWFHNLNAEMENRHKEKQFLEGLAGDLKRDVVEWKKERDFYVSAMEILEHYIRVGEGREQYDHERTTRYGKTLRRSSYAPLHNSRYEALKSSGTLEIIENKELMLTIMNYFQEAIPLIDMQRNRFNEENVRVLTAFKENAVFTREGDYDLAAMLPRPAVLFQVRMMNASIVIVEDYADIINRTEALILAIEKEGV